MSSLTFGPPITLFGPLPEAPVASLMNVPGVLRQPGEQRDDERFTVGVAILPYPPGTPSAHDPCSSGTFRVKDDAEEMPSPRFAAFTAYLTIECSAMSIGSIEEFTNRVEVALTAVESFAVEQQLSQGTGIPTNPYLGDANVNVLAGGAAQNPTNALAYLEESIGATGKQGMIHATPGVASHWFGGEFLGGKPLRTAQGTWVASGGGYIGATANGAPAAAGQSWAFSTGPVEVRRESQMILDLSEVLDRSVNDVIVRAERHMLVSWDTVLQDAVLVDWTP